MNYEIPAEVSQLITNGGMIARRFKLIETSSLCLLLALLEEEAVRALFRRLGLDWKEMTMEVTELIKLQVSAYTNEGDCNREYMQQGDDNTTGQFPPLDHNCSRICKLLFLEDKLMGTPRNAPMLVLRTMLHDRDNEAKALLETKSITYEKVADNPDKSSVDIGGNMEREVSNDYDFPGEDDAAYPNDDGPQNPSNKMGQTIGTATKTDSDTPIIDNFGTDLTDIAAKGGMDPVVGRETEIARVTQILCRRKKNNPIIIGEPGVGKSAIVEGLAQRIAKRQVPHLLQGKRVVTLNMATIVAGTQYRGQFEERLRRLIKELKMHPEIILFIDEIHTIIGAGSAPGSLDAANILKPALARGEVQCIGATTIKEFKKTIEKDGALDRRFQKVMVEPTGIEESVTILHNIKSRYEKHHNVTYTDEALNACVTLTARYVTDRALPDKAIDALDEAGAKAHLEGFGVPKEIEDKEKDIEALRQQKLEAAQSQNYELAAKLRDRVQALSKELETMTLEWRESRQLHPTMVDEEAIATVVSMMSGVPVSKVAAGENEHLKGMRKALNSRVIAQEKAVEKLTKAITRSRLGLKGNDRPIGTFMFVGPTGVGKTHLVKCLSEWMFGTRDALIRIDMSEYGEKFSVSRLLGAPPGYVGYEEGGQLTEQVRRHPYSVILFDEIEKGHKDVFNTLLQVMDEGRLTDGNGTTVDFRNTIIVLTSNSGTQQVREFGSGMGFGREVGQLSNEKTEEIILKTLRKQFAPEFLNRLDDIIMFNPLNKESALRIAHLEIAELKKRIESGGYNLTVDDAAISLCVDRGFDSQYGARSLKRSIQSLIEDPLCDYIMDHPDARSFTTITQDNKITIEAL